MQKCWLLSLIFVTTIFSGYAASDLDTAFEAYSKGSYQLFNEKFISPNLSVTEEPEISPPQSLYFLFLDRVCPVQRQIIKGEEFTITTTVLDYSETDLGKVDPEHLYGHYLESREDLKHDGVFSSRCTLVKDELSPEFGAMTTSITFDDTSCMIELSLFFDRKFVTTSLKMEIGFETFTHYLDLYVEGTNFFEFFDFLHLQIQNDLLSHLLLMKNN